MTIEQFDAAAAARAAIRRADGYNGHVVVAMGYAAERPPVMRWDACIDGVFRWVEPVDCGFPLPVDDHDISIWSVVS